MKGENKFFCDRCQSEQDTQKDMTIYQVNKILLVFLKRFTDRAKIDSSIEIPLKIDDVYMKSSRKVGEYSLYGMIVHSGGLNSGHYIAVCWDEKNGWMVFNDSRTR
jgi:ubiquitin C-terminal hydrolase